VLPFDQVAQFPPLFEALDNGLCQFQAAGYGVTITSLEEVFLKVGGDHDLDSFQQQQEAAAAATAGAASGSNKKSGVRGDTKEIQGEPSLALQVYGLWYALRFNDHCSIKILFNAYAKPLLSRSGLLALLHANAG